MGVLLRSLAYAHKILSASWPILNDSLHSTLLLLRILLHVLTFEARLLIHMDHNVAIVVQVSLGILLLLHAALHAMHVSHYSFFDFRLKLKLTI